MRLAPPMACSTLTLKEETSLLYSFSCVVSSFPLGFSQVVQWKPHPDDIPDIRCLDTVCRDMEKSAVMQQNGRCISFFGEFFKYLRKLSLALGWHAPSVLQTVFKNGVQGMKKLLQCF